MLEAYKQTNSLRAVGERYGISGSRVQQILKTMPEYQATKREARSNRSAKPGRAPSRRPASSTRGPGRPPSSSSRQSWKDIMNVPGTFDKLYQMRVDGGKWKDIAEAAGRSGDRRNAHSTMLQMKRLAKAKGYPWPVRRRSAAAAHPATTPGTGLPR